MSVGSGFRRRETWVDTNPTSFELEFEHTYPLPGTYNVQAVSWASDGRKLALWEWAVDLLLDRVGLPLSFIARSQTLLRCA
jgi:hypothetical protein